MSSPQTLSFNSSRKRVIPPWTFSYFSFPRNSPPLTFYCPSCSKLQLISSQLTDWANNTTFPFLFKPGTPKPGFDAQNGPGFDAIVGQAADGGVRSMDLQNGNDPAGKVTLPVEWVISRGGEYFFSPSIPTLRDVLGKKISAIGVGPAKGTKAAAAVRDEL